MNTLFKLIRDSSTSSTAVRLRALHLRMWRSGRRLPPDFEERIYTALHKDVAKSKMSGELHYLLYGKKEGRQYLQNLDDQRILVNPVPGIHLDAFRRSLGLPQHSSPLSEYFSRGKPTGLWDLAEIKKSPFSRTIIQPFSVIHFHCHYSELLEEFLSFAEPFLRRSSTSFVVTYSAEPTREAITRTLEEWELEARLITVPNQGRNLGALQHILALPEFAEVEIWSHFHSKKSAHLSTQEAHYWRRFIYTSLLRNTERDVDYDDILASMQLDPDLAIVFPDDPHEYGWGENLDTAAKLALKEGIEIGAEIPRFPVGAMFVARRSYLTRVLQLADERHEQDMEPLPLDGTQWHALERLLGALPAHFGWTFAVNRGDVDGYAWGKESL